MISANVVLDSVNEWGQRLTTLEVDFHRFVLAEFNTHRVFSRSSASSRAIPVKRQLKKIRENPALPLHYKYNQSGMQAAEFMSEEDAMEAEMAIRKLALVAADTVDFLSKIGDLGLHKQWANRYIEPWMWHKAIVSSTEWTNFFNQRISPLAQPEFDAPARAIKEALDSSTPKELEVGQWHTPYIQPGEEDEFSVRELVGISTARCARVSYLNQEGERDIASDFKLYERLRSPGDGPAHAAPLEQVATPNPDNRIEVRKVDFDGVPTSDFYTVPKLGNFLGYDQLRHRVLGF